MFIGTVPIASIDSFHNNLLDFCYHGFNQHYSFCKTLFKDTVRGKDHWMAKFMYHWSQKRNWFGFSWKTNLLFSKINGCISFIKISVDFFRRLKKYGVVDFCVSFLTTQSWQAESAKLCMFVSFVLIFIMVFFGKTSWIFHIEIQINNFAVIEHQSVITFLGNFSRIQNFTDQKEMKSCKSFGGVDVGGKRFKTWLKMVLSLFNCLQKLTKISLIGQKMCQCQLLCDPYDAELPKWK